MTSSTKNSIRRTLSSAFHTIINAVLPPVLLILVLRNLTAVALGLLLVSKWRTIAVKPQYWYPNLRANAVDIIVGISTLSFMHDANQAAVAGDTKFFGVQVAWAVWYTIWLLFIKPRSSEFMVGFQAASSLGFGLSSVFLYADKIPEVGLILACWFIAAASARHFLSSYEEPYISTISTLWGLFVAQVAWLLNRWLIVYEIADVIRIPQVALLVLLASYSIAELYHLAKVGKLTIRRRNQILIFGGSIMVLVVLLSDWTGNV